MTLRRNDGNNQSIMSAPRKSAHAFWALVDRDAGVQERVLAASRGASPLAAIAEVAAAEGFEVSAELLGHSIDERLGDEELAGVVGGALSSDAGELARPARLGAAGEWFAEMYTALKVKG